MDGLGMKGQLGFLVEGLKWIVEAVLGEDEHR